MDEKESKAVRAVTLKLAPETHELYKKVYEEVDPATANQFMETLLERFYSPVKTDQEKDRTIARLHVHIAELEEKIGQSEKVFQDYDVQISERDATILTLNESVIELTEKMDNMPVSGPTPPHSRVINFEPLNEKVAQYVADRETKNRKGQDWSISDLINFYIDQWFVKGNPNGSLDNVPDRIINQLKKELETA